MPRQKSEVKHKKGRAKAKGGMHRVVKNALECNVKGILVPNHAAVLDNVRMRKLFDQFDLQNVLHDLVLLRALQLDPLHCKHLVCVPVDRPIYRCTWTTSNAISELLNKPQSTNDSKNIKLKKKHLQMEAAPCPPPIGETFSMT